MGTPDFSVPLLTELINDEKFDVRAVYCMPDKPKGRGKRLQETPVKQTAKKAGIPVRTPATFKNNLEELQQLSNFEPDFLVVVAYGLILSSKVLKIPNIAAVNLHASILPKYRGPSPIHNAILSGDKETGNTAMLMNVKMDEGDILAVDKIKITDTDNLESLHDKLSIAGSKFLPSVLIDFAEGKIKPLQQDHTQATYTCKITPAMAKIDWSNSAIEISRLIRAMSPFPGAWFEFDNMRIKVFKATLGANTDAKPGTIIDSNNKSELRIACGFSSSILLLKLQRPGKSRLNVSDFLKGFLFKNHSLF